MLRSLLVLSFLLSLTGCALFGFQPSSRYDDRSFSIMNLNVFNQRMTSTMSQKNWKGDWLFRRERLELIDEQLRISRPDIIVFQELLTRRGSPSESDINILSYGALEGYEWDADLVSSYRDTQEMQYQAVAVGLPVRLAPTEQLTKRYQPIGIDGYLSYSLLELDQKSFLIVNLSMPSQAQKVDHWYKMVRNEIRELLDSLKLCRQRLLIAGYIPGSQTWSGYVELLNEFELKDSGAGFCEAASDCFTTSNLNDLFMGTAQGQSPSHAERILVHRDAIVTSSGVVMNKMKEKTNYAGIYGLERLWASRTYGWLSEIRLAECSATASKLD